MSATTAVSRNPIQEVPVESVVIPPDYIRQFYNDELMTGLQDSMDSVGQIYPLVVRPVGGNKFELIIGSRRLRAAKQQGHEKIAVVVCRFLENQEALILALAENLPRQDLTIFEEASAVLRLCGTNGHDLPPAEVAKRIGRPESWVRHRLQLLSMPGEVQDMVATGKLPAGHVKTLAALGDPEKQKRYAEASVRESLSQADLTRLLREEGESKIAGGQNYPTEPFTPRRAALKIRGMIGLLNIRVRPILQGKAWGRNRVVNALNDLQMLVGKLLEEAAAAAGPEETPPESTTDATPENQPKRKRGRPRKSQPVS